MPDNDVENINLYQIPIDIIPLNIAVYRLVEGKFIFIDFNKMAEKTEALKREELMGKCLTDIFPKVKEFGLLEVFERVNRTAQNETFDLKFYEDERISGWRTNEVIKLPNGDIMTMYKDLTQEKETKRLLQQSEEKFRAIAENSLIGIFIYTDHFIYINQALSDMSGYSAEELYTKQAWELISNPIQTEMKNNVQRRLSGEIFPQRYDDVEIFIKDGSKKIARIMTQTIVYEDGYAGLGTIVDITDIRETQTKLTLLAQAVEQTDELIRITDKHGIITYANDAFVAHSGYKQSELIGENCISIQSIEHDKAFYKELWETILSGKTYRNTLINRKKNQQIYYEALTITPIFNDKHEIQNFVATGKDITARIKMEEELQKYAITDDLTGLYNRRQGNKLLDIEFNKAQRYENSFTLLMFDIDNFKSVNDTFGHDKGDNILQELSKLVLLHIRKSDALIRWGGEEFIILSNYISKDKAIKFAEKLRVAITSYDFDIDMNISVSMGISLCKNDDTKESLLKRVDEGLYEAKESGRNCVKYR